MYKQQLAGCQGTNYIVKPAFRYLNGDMRGVDWWSNPCSTSMAPGQNTFYTRAMSQCLSNRQGTMRNLLVKPKLALHVYSITVFTRRLVFRW